MTRTFISMDLENEKVKEEIKLFQNRLDEIGANLKFVKPELIHLTLEFLGDLKDDQIEKVKTILKSLSFPKFTCRLEGLKLFPNENYIRVISASLQGDTEDLKNVQTELRSKLKKEGFRVDKRSFKPHLTLARVKSGKNKNQLVEFIKENNEVNFGEFELSEIRLKKSVLKPEGPEYSNLFVVKAEEAS